MDLRALRVARAGLAIQDGLDSLETLVPLVLLDLLDQLEIEDSQEHRV